MSKALGPTIPTRGTCAAGHRGSWTSRNINNDDHRSSRTLATGILLCNHIYFSQPAKVLNI